MPATGEGIRTPALRSSYGDRTSELTVGHRLTKTKRLVKLSKSDPLVDRH